MPAETAVARVGARSERSPRTLITRRTARSAIRSGVGWGYVFGVVVASSALTYTRFYKTQAERDRLAATFGSNRASSALFGPAPALNTVAGFTVFKTSMTLMLVGAVWGLLTSTRLLRGEEDAGRWELLLAGRTTRRGAAFQALVGLAAGAFVLWAVTAIITVIAGSSSKVHIGARAGSFLALALVSSSVMFLAVGAVTSQLAATRRQAAAYAAVGLGLSYAIRMVADSGIGLQWLAWLSPLGWVERLQPLTSPRPAVLLPIAALTGVLAAVAVHLAGGRDLGASTLPDRARGAPHLRLLASATVFTVRLVRPSVIAWTVAVAASGLLTGVVANAAGSTMSGSSVQEVFSRLGAHAGGLAAFLGVSFLILAVLVAFAAASQVTSTRVEEADGRLDHLLVQPVSRSSWLGGRLLVAVVALALLGVVAGIATWVGTVTQGSGLRFSSAVGAGVNVVPPAILLLGAGALTIGAWPRRASLVVYGLLAWSLLVEAVGGFAVESHWLLDTSVFHQMAAAPAVSPRWDVNGVMVGAGLLAMLAGGVLFTRRDIQGA